MPPLWRVALLFSALPFASGQSLSWSGTMISQIWQGTSCSGHGALVMEKTAVTLMSDGCLCATFFVEASGTRYAKSCPTCIGTLISGTHETADCDFGCNHCSGTTAFSTLATPQPEANAWGRCITQFTTTSTGGTGTISFITFPPKPDYNIPPACAAPPPPNHDDGLIPIVVTGALVLVVIVIVGAIVYVKKNAKPMPMYPPQVQLEPSAGVPIDMRLNDAQVQLEPAAGEPIDMRLNDAALAAHKATPAVGSA